MPLTPTLSRRERGRLPSPIAASSEQRLEKRELVRRVVYSVAASLDGYIAGPNGEFDWIPKDPAIDWGAFMGRFDTVLMGRRTFEVTQRQGSGEGLPNMRTFVFSRTLRASEHPGITVVAVQRYDDGKTVRWTLPLTILPASSSSPQHLWPALLAGAVGLVAIIGGLAFFRHRRQPHQRL